MKKITSFLMMAVLCCASVFAQETVGTELPEYKLVKVGVAQAEMVPGQWYFLQNSRNGQNNSYEYFALPGEAPVRGGFVTDRGSDKIGLSAQSVLEAATSEDGVSSEEYKKHIVRFVAVEGEEGAYSIQFATGNWIAENPDNGVVSNNQYIGGLAGKWNFYLVKNAEGAENTAGRFAWNKYNMQNRVDNNGVGNNVCFWNSGEITIADLDWNQTEEHGDAGIIGNNIWQIYDIQIVGDLDLYADALQALSEDFSAITSQNEGNIIQSLIDGNNVGTEPGNYRKEDVDAFLEIHEKVQAVMDMWDFEGVEAIQAVYPTAEDLKALNESYVGAWNHMIENKVPRAASNIAPGYYTINSCLFWYTTKQDSVFYTKEEADSLNEELGYMPTDSLYIVEGSFKEMKSSKVAAPIKSMYSAEATSNGNPVDALAWGNQQAKAEFLWKIETVEGKPTEYRMTNVANGKSHISIGQSANSILQLNDTATVCFDWRNDKEAIKYADAEGNEVADTVVSFNIRSSKQAEGGYNYLHCGGHNGGAGTGPALIVGWSDGGATRWYLAPVDEATVDMWLNGPEAQLRAKFAKADSIISAFPAQLEIAKDIETTIFENDSVVVTADQFYSQYTTEDAQTIPEGQTVYDFLLDGKQSTYWHSAWEAGAVGQKVHYLQVNAAEALEGLYAVKLQRRPVSGDHITQLIVKGYTEAPTDETTFEEGTELGVLDFPLSANNETLTSKTFDATGMNYLRFYSTTTAAASSGGGANRGYWHASAFNVFKASAAPRYETTQYDARKAEADALSAAIAAWEEKGFTVDSLELIEDETFIAAYNTLVAAAEAWGAVYVDPAALRAAIAAAPGDELFVIGNNPGQWKEGVVTPKATVEAAEAYNASGAYTPAKSEEHIAAIAKAEADVWAAANKVETGKWYRFSFPAEEAYETFGWDKTGAQEVENETAGELVSPSLFGKIIAPGISDNEYVTYENEDGEEVELLTYDVATSDYLYEGNSLFYFDSEDEEFEEGEDLFRFIQATDSTFMIQNKATGLFLNGNVLTAHPAYYDVKAIGAGANVIGWTNIFGNRQQSYLHGQRADNRLVTWNATNLGSNSMMMIEEVEAVAEEPATEYVQKLWPGKVNTYTYPVDVTVSEGATAYGAELVVTESDTTVVLKAFAENKVEKGLPFILIANLEGEYVSTTDALKAIKDQIKEEENIEELTGNDELEAQIRLDEMYTEVSMNHGMEVDTLVKTTLSMRGTLKSTTVEAGKALVASEDGFAHILKNTTVPANGAWIACDFDPESADVLGSIAIKVEGEIESGINEVLNKVAQSGKIYNAAGQLVGKGNINTVNNLPAGIYVVNGVKVIKK